MKTLLDKLAQLEVEAKAIIANPEAKAEEIQGKMAEIESVKAKIEAQKELDKLEAAKNEPVNKPFIQVGKDRAADRPFNSFGEQMLAIVNAGQPGGAIDPRLLAIQNATGASEGVPADGGFLVQTDFSSELLRNVYETGILAPLCKKVTISSNANGLKINGVDESNRANGSRWGGVQGYWANEAATVTASKPKFREIQLTLNKLMALYYSTDELLQDAAAMDSILKQAFSEELNFKVDDALIEGTGAGQPLGILKAGCLVTQAKETGQAADTIVHENITNMWSRMIARSRANAVWLINQEVEPQFDNMALSIGTGGQLSPFAMEYMMKGTIKGRPVIPIEQCSALGDLGDIILADFSQYLLGDKGGLQTASSIHVKFLYDETAFRITYRIDGQPVRATAITPFKGTAARTLSSFITLAERA